MLKFGSLGRSSAKQRCASCYNVVFYTIFCIRNFCVNCCNIFVDWWMEWIFSWFHLVLVWMFLTVSIFFCECLGMWAFFPSKSWVHEKNILRRPHLCIIICYSCTLDFKKKYKDLTERSQNNSEHKICGIDFIFKYISSTSIKTVTKEKQKYKKKNSLYFHVFVTTQGISMCSQ